MAFGHFTFYSLNYFLLILSSWCKSERKREFWYCLTSTKTFFSVWVPPDQDSKQRYTLKVLLRKIKRKEFIFVFNLLSESARNLLNEQNWLEKNWVGLPKISVRFFRILYVILCQYLGYKWKKYTLYMYGHLSDCQKYSGKFNQQLPKNLIENFGKKWLQ